MKRSAGIKYGKSKNRHNRNRSGDNRNHYLLLDILMDKEDILFMLGCTFPFSFLFVVFLAMGIGAWVMKITDWAIGV